METLGVLIAFALTLAVSVLPIPLVVWVARRYRDRGSRACPACGYPKEGALSETCPECGTDWNDVDAFRRRMPAGVELVLVPAILLLPAVLMVLLVLGLVVVFESRWP